MTTPRINPQAVVELVEAAYSQSLDDTAWKVALSDAAFRLVGCADGFGLIQYRWDRDDRGNYRIADVLDVRHFGEHVHWGEDAKQAHLAMPSAFAEQVTGRTRAIPASTAAGTPGADFVLRSTWSLPIMDVLGIVACEPDGNGLALAVGARERFVFTPRARSMLDRVAFHLAAGFRLRLSDHHAIEEAEAVLTPSGKILHACEAAKGKRDLLDEGRRRRDEARKTKHDAEKALEIWRGLVAGRWSLVDHFDTDGKRFLLAMKNTPTVSKRDDLTPRERRACGLAAMGHRDKEIAYMLGLSLPSITAALHRARGKLGVKSRSDLARIWRRDSRTSPRAEAH